MSNLMIALFVLQILVALLLIIVVMLQSSDEDALSGIGASAGNSGILSHKTSVDFVTKLTIWLGIIMIINSLALTLVVKRDYAKNII
jgi:preprotein translocase subunit SecG